MSYLGLLVTMAKEAGVIIRRHFRPEGVSFELKFDRTEVTAADREIAAHVTELLGFAYPGAILICEENDFPRRMKVGGVEFVVDPVDGTRDLTRGGGQCTTTFARLLNHVVMESVIFAPLLSGGPKMYTAKRGSGAFCNGERIHVSDRMSGLRIAVTNAGHPFELYHAAELVAALEALGCEVIDVKSASHSCAQLAAGHVDGVVFGFETLHDTVMGSLMVEEAGGRTSDLEGNPLDFAGNTVPGFIMANSQIVLDFLRMAVARHRRAPTPIV